MPLALPIIAGAAVVGVGAGLYGAVQQNKQSKREGRARQAIENRRSQRERVASVREAQVLAAQSQVLSENLGVGDSSGASGQQSSIGSTAASNQSFVNQVQGLNEVRADAMARSAKIGNTVSAIQGITNAVSSVAGAYGADYQSQQSKGT